MMDTPRSFALFVMIALSVPGALADSFWDHNGSEMRLHADGSTRIFTYERPRQGIAAQGVGRGTVLFEGSIEGEMGNYSGTAYLFSARCGSVAYEVTGELQADGHEIWLSGEAPRRDRSTCKQLGFREDKLRFAFVRSDEPPVRFPPMTQNAICDVTDPDEYRSCLEREANEICRGRREFEDLVRCFRAALLEVYSKSGMSGSAASIVDSPFIQCSDGVCRMAGGGPAPYCMRLDANLVRECDGDVMNERCVDVECPLRRCRKVCSQAE